MLTNERKQKSRKTFLILSTLLILLTVAITIVQTRQTQDIRSSAAGRNDTLEVEFVDAEKVIKLINDYRKSKGLQELKSNPKLQDAAAWMSKDQDKQNKMTHIDSKGRSLEERVKDFGYSYARIVENVAQGGNEQQTFNAWKQSEEHNANMLCKECTEIGLAYYAKFWTMDAGRPLDSTDETDEDSQPPDDEDETDLLTITPTETEEQQEEDDESDTSSRTPISPTPDSGTRIALTILIPGTSASPKNPTRAITLTVFDPSTQEEITVTGDMMFVSGDKQKFTATLSLPQNLKTGEYSIKVSGANTLTETVPPGVIRITKDALTTAQPLTLYPFDFDQNGDISLKDFLVLRNCVRDISCESEAADVNDDGNIDILDYNMMVSYLGNQKGD